MRQIRVVRRAQRHRIPQHTVLQQVFTKGIVRIDNRYIENANGKSSHTDGRLYLRRLEDIYMLGSRRASNPRESCAWVSLAMSAEFSASSNASTIYCKC